MNVGTWTRKHRGVTRSRLLAAARSSFADLGIGGTSVVEVVHRADYTRGAFYSNFESKDALVLAVLEDMVAEQVTDIHQRATSFTRSETHSGGWRCALQQALSGVQADHELVPFLAEMQLHAVRDAAFAQTYGTCLQQIQEQIAHAVRAFAECHRLTLRVPATQASRILMSLWLSSSRVAAAHLPPDAADPREHDDVYVVATTLFTES